MTERKISRQADEQKRLIASGWRRAYAWLPPEEQAALERVRVSLRQDSAQKTMRVLIRAADAEIDEPNAQALDKAGKPD